MMDKMMIVVVICVLVAVLYFGFIMLKEYIVLSGKNVNHQSKMAKKYQYLIERMIKSPSSKILVLTDKDV